MTKKMLIDATHAEETRVVVAEGNKVDEFDFESITKRQLAGNIYLAKVTRVEPSLQAAFVDYGGNRHGFLAFSEIHPDYYQIPVEDRKRLLEEEAEFARRHAEEHQEAADQDEAAEEEPAEEAAPQADGAPDEAKATTPEAEAEAEEPAPEKPKRKPRSRAKKPAKSAKAAEASKDAEAPQDEPEDAPQEAPKDPEDPPETIAEDSGLGAEDEDVVTADVTEDGDLLVDTPEEAKAEKPKRRRRSTKTKAAEDGADSDAIEGDAPEAEDAEKPRKSRSRSRTRSRTRRADDADADAPGATEVGTAAQDDPRDEMSASRAKPRMRRYNIQEVIKVRQILLVQVVKEERGNKGAALTTYLSLAGRYCVLMPNTARGGGISRKITNAVDRKKLKSIASEIEVPEGAGLIVRTAGAKRTKMEIKRDYEYLLRQWETIRETTLSSVAPKLIYEEGSLIKRSIRDLYNKDIDEIIVEGESGFKEAKEYMKMLLPSHAKNVKPYADPMPLFARHQVESYLGGMINPTVQLKSGGYIVIGVTEALVAIDVNSGRATKEGSIEETALKTNLEAAEEIARQMRLRDLAGLLVIDFIDMDERRNNNAVEKRLKDALKTDRARIQIGRISGFGLLEMSRQRLRPGVLEATTTQCPHCHGTGYVRSDENMALTILREIEEEGVRQRCKEVLAKVPMSIANYLHNQKREHVAMIEGRFGLSVRIEADPHLIPPDYELERLKTASRIVAHVEGGTVLPVEMPDVEEAEAQAVEAPQPEDEDGQRKKGRRRRKRGGRRNRGRNEDVAEAQVVAEEADGAAEAAEAMDAPADADATETEAETPPAAEPAPAQEIAPSEDAAPVAEEDDALAEKPKRKPRTRRKKAEPEPAAVAEAAPVAVEAPAAEAPEPSPEPESAAAPEPVDTPEPAPLPEPEAAAPAPEPEPAPAPEPDRPKRRGWWSRAMGK